MTILYCEVKFDFDESALDYGVAIMTLAALQLTEE